MSLLQRVRNLASRENITLAELERRLNFSNGQIGKWSKSNPSIEKVQKVADYFNVSIDYLLGRDERISYDQPEEIMIMHRAAENMTDEQRQKALLVLETMFDNWDEIIKK